jgi:carboxylesterase
LTSATNEPAATTDSVSAARDHSYRFDNGRTGVVLLHGLSGTPMELRYQALGLSRAGYSVSVPQLAGHCGTLDDLRATSWRDWAASALAAVDDMKSRCDTVLVGGLSMGAVLSLYVAAERPDTVAGTALLAPTFRFDGWAVPWYAALFRLVQDRWTANRIMFHEFEPYGIKDGRLRAFVMNALQSDNSATAGLPGTPGLSMLEFRYLVKDVEQRLGSIRQPTLIVHPRHDDRASLSNAAMLQRRLGGLVTTVVLDDCYHVITLDRQRDLVNEALIEFVDKRAAKAGTELARPLKAVSKAVGA